MESEQNTIQQNTIQQLKPYHYPNKPEQQFPMNDQVVETFIQFYVDSINDKTKSNEFISLFKPYTVIKHKQVTFSHDNLMDFLNEYYKFIIDPLTIDFTYTIVGDRRANILLSCNMFVDQTQLYCSHYIQFAYSNDKEYWIHSILFNSR